LKIYAIELKVTNETISIKYFILSLNLCHKILYTLITVRAKHLVTTFVASMFDFIIFIFRLKQS